MPYDLIMIIMLRQSFSDMFLCLPSNILYRNIEVWSSPQQSRPSIFDRQRKEESSQQLKSIPNSKISDKSPNFSWQKYKLLTLSLPYLLSCYVLALGRITALVLCRQSPLNLHQFCLIRGCKYYTQYGPIKNSRIKNQPSDFGKK